MAVIKRFDVFSTAKICGLLSALILFLFGLVGLVMFLFMPKEALPPEMSFTAGSLISAWLIDTVLFAVFGFLGGALWAGFYNLIAKRVGGIEIELSEAVVSKKPKKK